jgi:hypothetical protein
MHRAGAEYRQSGPMSPKAAAERVGGGAAGVRRLINLTRARVRAALLRLKASDRRIAPSVPVGSGAAAARELAARARELAARAAARRAAERALAAIGRG